MRVTATEFGKSLFPVLERALRGEAISASKVARAKRQHALLCDPDSIVHSDRALLAELESEWRNTGC